MKGIATLLAVRPAPFALAGCGGDDSASRTTEPAVTTTARSRPRRETTPETDDADRDDARPAKPKPTTITIRVVGGVPQGGIARPKVKKGDRVVIVVRADAGEEVHMHGYDLETHGDARASRCACRSRRPSRAGSRWSCTTRTRCSPSSRSPREPRRPRDRDGPGPPDPDVALLLGRAPSSSSSRSSCSGRSGGRPAAGAHEHGRALGETRLAARARPAADRRRLALRRALRARLGRRPRSATPTRSGTSRRRGST